jgi:hypothetical protein
LDFDAADWAEVLVFDQFGAVEEFANLLVAFRAGLLWGGHCLIFWILR